jgi:hypothetical protein
MIIKTRKLPATSTEGERMRATAANGATLTIPMDHRRVDPHLDVATRLNQAMGWADVVTRWTRGTSSTCTYVTMERV